MPRRAAADFSTSAASATAPATPTPTHARDLDARYKQMHSGLYHQDPEASFIKGYMRSYPSPAASSSASPSDPFNDSSACPSLSLRSSLGPSDGAASASTTTSPRALMYEDEPERPPRTAALAGQKQFAWRHNVYKLQVVMPADERARKSIKTSDAYHLMRDSMMPIELLAACGNTPQPADYLPSCKYYTHAQLEAVARSMQMLDAAFLSSGCDFKSFVVGQTGYTGTACVHRGVLAVLAPQIPMAPLAIHERRSAQRGRAHTGLLHSCAPNPDVENLLTLANQRAYYDRDGVWIALNAVAARELALFELTMSAYRNGVRTGRPFAPMTVELSRSKEIAAQVRAF